MSLVANINNMAGHSAYWSISYLATQIAVCHVTLHASVLTIGDMFNRIISISIILGRTSSWLILMLLLFGSKLVLTTTLNSHWHTFPSRSFLMEMVVLESSVLYNLHFWHRYLPIMPYRVYGFLRQSVSLLWLLKKGSMVYCSGMPVLMTSSFILLKRLPCA